MTAHPDNVPATERPSPRSARYWRPLFERALARGSAPAPPPADLRVLLGQGVHLLLTADDGRLFHVSVHPASAGLDGPITTATTTVRYSGDRDPDPDQRRWLKALARAALLAERDAGWAGFLAWAQEKPGVSLPNTHADDARRTSGGDVLIRLLAACNAHCAFCSCIGTMPDRATSVEEVAADLAAARAQGRDGVTFTGGEPTLFRELPEAVRLAKAAGFLQIGLQTNGSRLAEADAAGRAYVARLAELGLTSLFLSLHSHIAARHDEILELPGAFDRAVAAVDAALDAGVMVRLNHVISRANQGDVSQFADFVAHRWPGRVAVTWSFVSPIGWALEHLEVLPRISDVTPSLARALDTCAQAGIEADVPGLCGLPMCTLPDHLRYFAEAHDPAPPPKLPTRRHVAACDACALRARCSGYWSVYLDAHGDTELGPPPAWRDAASPPHIPPAVGLVPPGPRP